MCAGQRRNPRLHHQSSRTFLPLLGIVHLLTIALGGFVGGSEFLCCAAYDSELARAPAVGAHDHRPQRHASHHPPNRPLGRHCDG